MATPALLQEPPSPQPAPQKQPPRPEKYWLHILLFVITLLSTTIVGMRYADNFNHGVFPLSSEADLFPYAWVFTHLNQFAQGLPFSCTLLAILLTHEFGHYFASRVYGVQATLPFLLPAPTLSGTAGALIRLKSRIKSRAALLAIGVFGPLCGFVVAVATSILGLALSKPIAAEPVQLVTFSHPLLMQLLTALLDGPFHMHLDGPLLWHPVFVASWIGLLITSLNLVPAGQLDGGHILYALSPRVHRYTTYAMLAVLVYGGIMHWLGWLVWAALLALPGMRHPRVFSDDPLPHPLVLLAPLALIIFVLCATPEPFHHSSLVSIIARMRGL